MSKQVQDAYIVAATRTPIGRSGRGYFRNTRPDDLLIAAMRHALTQVPTLDPKAIEDAVIGCSFPEAEQGINVARAAAVLAGLPHSVAGVTVNRFCASGLTALQMAADRIRVSEADVICGGDVDAGSLVTEEYLMTLERQAFCSLLDNPKTQERVMGMMSTGKPVRN